ncbi:MAG: acyl-CoA reductase [Lentimicrobium sp.]
MKKNTHNIEFLSPKEPDIAALIQNRPEEPFSENATAYLNALSLILFKDPATREYADVATFAYFCRNSNLVRLKKQYYPGDKHRSGRGMVFHITPSNMPLTFAYSFVCGILSGNVNIVKVSSIKTAQADIIFNALEKLSKERKYRSYSSRLALVRYNVQSSATAYFSSICDVRVIWGGDETIDEIRKNSIPPRAFDVTFADRYSLCVIDADKYIHEKSPEKVALGFYNDTYLFDQNSCSSPHLLIWLGSDENTETAKKIFWDNLYTLVKAKYTIQPHSVVDKLTTFYHQAAHYEEIKHADMPDNLIWRTELKDLPKDIDHYRCSSGYFSEYKASSLSELSGILSGKYQTLSYYGVQKEDFIKFIGQKRPKGIDRIVPIGKTNDFSLTWDGFNLIDTLSREITIL